MEGKSNIFLIVLGAVLLVLLCAEILVSVVFNNKETEKVEIEEETIQIETNVTEEENTNTSTDTTQDTVEELTDSELEDLL